MKQWFTAIVLIYLAVFGYLIYGLINLPMVMVSNATASCVEVLPAEAGTCDNLPEKYEMVWVK